MSENIDIKKHLANTFDIMSNMYEKVKKPIFMVNKIRIIKNNNQIKKE